MGTTNGVNNGGETGLSQDDIGSTTSSVSGTLYSDTDVCTGQSRGIVGTITGHGAEVAETLDTFDDFVLVLGEDTGKIIGIQDHVVEGSVFVAAGRTVLQDDSGIHVVTQTETTSGFLGDGELITSDHLDLDTENHSIIDGLLGVLTGRVEDGKEADEFKTVTLSLVITTLDLLKSDSQGMETARSELLNISLESVLDLVGLVARAKLDDDAGHTLGDALELSSGLLTVGTLGTLVDGVERLEVEDLDTSVGRGWIWEGIDDTSVDGVLVLGTGSVGSQLDDILKGKGAISPDNGTMVSLSMVRVSVLSEHRMVTAVNSSIVVIQVTMALYLTSC